MGHLGPRMSHPASQLWIHCNDCFTILHNERGQETHGNYMVSVTVSVLLTLNLLSAFLLILHKNRDQEVHEHFISCLLRKKSPLEQFGFFKSFFNVWLCVVKTEPGTVTTGSLKSQDMIKILKQSGHDFSGKRLYGEYCT